ISVPCAAPLTRVVRHSTSAMAPCASQHPRKTRKFLFERAGSSLSLTPVVAPIFSISTVSICDSAMAASMVLLVFMASPVAAALSKLRTITGRHEDQQDRSEEHTSEL